MTSDKLSIKPGDVFVLERTFTADEVRTFTSISGDAGAHHVQPDARGRLMLQGLLTATLATQFGGSIDYLASEMTFRFHRPAFAGDTIRSAASLKVPMVCVTLLHRKGFFTQKLDANGWQTEEP